MIIFKVSIAFLFGFFSFAKSVDYIDPNSLSGFGGQNRSGFESLSCQKIVTDANKNTFERSKKMIDDAGLTLQNCKTSTFAQMSRTLANIAGFNGFESPCQKKLSFILNKLKMENEDFRNILKIRMALYDVQFIYGKSPKAKEWFKFNCKEEYRTKAFLPLALMGRPQKPSNTADSDKELIEKLAGHCEASEPMIGSAIPTFTVVANELYGNQGLVSVAKDRAVCQKIIDEFRMDQIRSLPQLDKAESEGRKASDCPPLKAGVVCQDILLTNSVAAGGICKFAQIEHCLLEKDSNGARAIPGTKSTAGHLK